MNNIRKAATLLACAQILFFSCSHPVVTALDEKKAAAIKSLVSGMTRSGFENRLQLFANNRNMARSPAEVASVEAAMVSLFGLWGYSVSQQPVTIDSITDYNIAASASVYHQGPYTMNNIIAAKPGNDASLKPILVGTHHDTVYQAPGANDNGSGCAAVLEMAFAIRNSNFDRTVIFASFAFEENGLIGSGHYVAGLSDDRLPAYAIVFDTIGFTSPRQGVVPGADLLLGMPTVGDFIGAFGSSDSRSLVMDFLSCAARDAGSLKVYGVSVDSGFPNDPLLRDLMRSDHAWFWSRGVPALFLTDTANLRVGNVYHRAQDDVAHVDTDFAAKVAQAALSTLCVRAGLRD